MLLWENGPEDTSILRALAICIKDAVVDYNHKSQKGKVDILGELSNVVYAKMVFCLGKNLKKSVKKDEILENLHFEKITKLIRETKDEEGPFMKTLKTKSMGWHFY